VNGDIINKATSASGFNLKLMWTGAALILKTFFSWLYDD